MQDGDRTACSIVLVGTLTVHGTAVAFGRPTASLARWGGDKSAYATAANHRPVYHRHIIGDGNTVLLAYHGSLESVNVPDCDAAAACAMSEVVNVANQAIH